MAEFDAVLFSDLHLSETSPELNALFEAFIDRVKGTPEIACLGDLTQYWIGKRHLENDFGQYINAQMARLAQGSKRALWVPGNRDFLFDTQARKAGYEVYRNRYEGRFAGAQVALEHGDRFCTLDRKYQRFRWWFRKVPWRFLEIFVSSKRGHRWALKIRSKSEGKTARKNPSMFGIQSDPVEKLVGRGADVIVCGHVHTPFTREYSNGGRHGMLHVMGDWHEDGSVVCVVKDGEFNLVTFDGDRFIDFEAPGEQQLYTPSAEASVTG